MSEPKQTRCHFCAVLEADCNRSQQRAKNALAVSVRNDPLLLAVVLKRNRCCGECRHA